RILRRHPADRMRTAPLHSTIGSARELTELTRNQVSGLTGAVQWPRSVGTRQWNRRYIWSAGEVIAVAHVLGADTILDASGETHDSVVYLWAYDLYGIRGGQTEEAAGYPLTKAFFAANRRPARS
ncbi:hypothetical protein QMK17_25855, partial [Rhodococcus sp. G-MC3]|uniref:hypothetical protein n=1 Tax=Rhodococcus sp. G-MC3 TaxID=3046209 RepID=UPI0024B9A842